MDVLLTIPKEMLEMNSSKSMVSDKFTSELDKDSNKFVAPSLSTCIHTPKPSKAPPIT